MKRFIRLESDISKCPGCYKHTTILERWVASMTVSKLGE
jgi:hypothetical protein